LGSCRAILDIVSIAVNEKVPLIQIREKKISAKSLFELTSTVANFTRGSATRLLVNDRADIALAAGADGVHLAANYLPVDVIRRNFPDNFIIGISTHSIEELVNASENGADFALFGPVFATPGKSEPHGVAKLSEVCDLMAPFPVIGIGGIDEFNYRLALDAGASGVASIRSLNDPDSLRKFSQG